ncbi:MAG: hypothetical protein ACE37F_03575 [Nannocystaceae bacterium]|nr:hypothetical protein [bacterium]
MSQAALDADALRLGTTNVDFNDGMRAALARIPDGFYPPTSLRRTW